ncbi:MAG: prepilin-type N-terminal cleavage/methylation domain-containing protein [Candidatus Omnitrophica bacterium]|nr:prepilin-type N-terminal cleavage/methylation domain-containing protein [Candidatus Omnitrophota bacterium]
MRKKGFTLIELLIVIIIISILSSIALPQYVATLEKARSAEAVINIFSVKSALDGYWYEHGFNLTGAILPIDGSQGSLNIDNPNAISNKLYSYRISGLGSAAEPRSYTVTATRTTNDETYIVMWVQEDNYTGKFYRSANLGGPVYSP